MCGIVFLCSLIGSFRTLFNIGMGTAIWCIFFGVIFRLLSKDATGFMPLGNSIIIFNFISKLLNTLEFYIKISIVLLAVNLKDVLIVGAKALIVGWVETTFVS